MIAICIKDPVGKKLGLSNIAPSPHCPLSLAFSRRHFLGVRLPSTGNPPHPSYRKMREAQTTFYIPETSSGPMEVDERVPSAVLLPPPFLVNPELPSYSSGS